MKINNIESQKVTKQQWEFIFWFEEIHLVIAYLRYNSKQSCWDLTSIGNRLLDLSKEDRKDFWKVYKKTIKKLENES